MVKHKKARSFKIQNLKTSLKNPETLLRSPEFVIHQKSNTFHSLVLRVENQDFEIILLEKNRP